MPAPPRFPSDEIAGEAHTGVVETLERIWTHGSERGAEAVARGTMAGIAEWLVVRLGRRAAYEALQRKADEIAAKAEAGGAHDETQAERKRTIQ